jgi:oligosaccharide 4-alpha-D-glucosyltransferase
MKIVKLCIAFWSVIYQADAQQFSILNNKSNKQETVIITQNGEWKFSLFPGNIIKTIFIPSKINKNENISDAVIAAPLQLKSEMIKKDGYSIIKWNKNLSVTISAENINFQLFNISISLNNAFNNETERGFDFLLKKDEMIFGAGERSLPLNRRGYKMPLKNNPWYGYTLNADALNYSVPFILSNKNYAIFFDNPSIGYLDIGKTNSDLLRYSATSGELCFYIIPGDNYQEIFNNYKLLVGTQPLPPRWAMGNFMSRFGYTSEAQTKSIFNNMKKDSIPFDALIFDLFWFGDSIQQTLGNLEWINKKAWPNPKKMIADFKKENIKTILITEPFVVNTSTRYEDSKKYHTVDSNNKPFFMTDFYFGNGGLLDIFRNDTKQWFFDKYKTQMQIGVEGWWGDLG